MNFEYNKLPSHFVKYLIISLIIFCLVVIIPYNKLGVKDSVILAIILTLTIAIIENVTMIMTRDPTPEKFDGNVVSSDVTQPEKPNQVPVQPTPATSSETVKPDSKQTEVDKQQTEQKSDEKNKQVDEHTVSKLYKNSPHGDDKEASGSRDEDDVITSDMPYTDYHHIPIGDTYQKSDFEYGYSFLPPEKWYPTPPFPPVCVSEKRCPVCPTYTTGTPVDVKEWNSSRKIMPPDGINTKYIKDTLNSGR